MKGPETKVKVKLKSQLKLGKVNPKFLKTKNIFLSKLNRESYSKTSGRNRVENGRVTN